MVSFDPRADLRAAVFGNPGCGLSEAAGCRADERGSARFVDSQARPQAGHLAGRLERRGGIAGGPRQGDEAHAVRRRPEIEPQVC